MDKLEPIRAVFRQAGLYNHAADDLLCERLAEAISPAISYVCPICAASMIEIDEALLRQALEALECSDWYTGQLELIVYSHDDTEIHDARAKVQNAIAALRERLGEGEPR